jgi:nicotinamide-nucleotide amidase
MGRKMAEINKRQAFVVEGSEAIPNPNGTAPGLWLDLPGRILMVLPGPPRELKPMFQDVVEPRLRAILPELHLATRHFRVAGMGESDLDQLISPVYKPYGQIATTILAAAGDIQIHLRCFRPTREQAEELVAELGAKIQEALGNRIYSLGGEPIEAAVGMLLKQRGATLSVAESCTAGKVAARLTDTPGSSDWFLGGFIVYGTQMKTRLLGLDERVVHERGVVSEEVAVSMADSARDRTGASYGISVTGEAGPVSSTPGIDPGTVWIGIATPDGVEAKQFRFPGDRHRVREFAVQYALNLVRQKLL